MMILLFFKIRMMILLFFKILKSTFFIEFVP
jgi:hypothetical protein